MTTHYVPFDAFHARRREVRRELFGDDSPDDFVTADSVIMSMLTTKVINGVTHIRIFDPSMFDPTEVLTIE